MSYFQPRIPSFYNFGRIIAYNYIAIPSDSPVEQYQNDVHENEKESWCLRKRIASLNFVCWMWWKNLSTITIPESLKCCYQFKLHVSRLKLLYLISSVIPQEHWICMTSRSLRSVSPGVYAKLVFCGKQFTSTVVLRSSSKILSWRVKRRTPKG